MSTSRKLVPLFLYMRKTSLKSQHFILKINFPDAVMNYFTVVKYLGCRLPWICPIPPFLFVTELDAIFVQRSFPIRILSTLNYNDIFSVLKWSNWVKQCQVRRNYSAIQCTSYFINSATDWTGYYLSSDMYMYLQ